jgi:hypothetical protein
MFCTKCGSHVTDATQSCPACGATLDEDGAEGQASARTAWPQQVVAPTARDVSPHPPHHPSTSIPVAPSATAVARAPRASSGGRRLALLLVGVVIGALLAGLAVFILTSRRGYESASAGEENSARRAAESTSNVGKSLVNNSDARTSSTRPTHEQASAAAATQIEYGRPDIIPRSIWGAKLPAGEMISHSPERITICHTATTQQLSVSIEEKMRRLQSFSQRADSLASGRFKPAWPDVPYHFYVAADGRIAEGRDLRYAGDTNTDYDTAGHILIVLEGNFEMEYPTQAQLDSLRRLSAWLIQSLGISPSRIKEHKDYAPTACPGKNMGEEIIRLRRELSR